MTCLVLSFDRTVRKFCAYRHGVDTPTLRSTAKSDPKPQRFASRSITGLLLLLLCCSAVALFALAVLPAMQANAQAVSGSVIVPPTIHTYAGNGTQGYSGDGGPAIHAELYSPQNVAVDRYGNLYFSDVNISVIRKVTAATGIITTIAGNGNACSSSTSTCGDGGLATSAQMSDVYGVALDSAGDIYIADYLDNRIRVVANFTGTILGVNVTAGNIYTVAGTGTQGYAGDGGVATSAELHSPVGVALDSVGNLYISELANHVVRMVAVGSATIFGQTVVANHIYTVAGSGTYGYGGDGGPATSASMYNPWGLALDSAGDLFISDSTSDTVRVVAAATGKIFGQSVTADDIYTVTGTNFTNSYTGDGGLATNATVFTPEGIHVDSAGNLDIADSGNNVLRQVSAATGIIHTIAGNGTGGFAGDGGLAVQAEMYLPSDVTVDSRGNIYVADNGTFRIRQIDANTVVPSTPVGTRSASQNILVELTAGSPISSISVPKAQNGAQEFTVGTVTGCNTGGINAADAVCTVPITFNPQYPGPRAGALTLYSSGTTILGTVGITGIGTGPLGVFSPGTVSALNVSGVSPALSGPAGVAEDAAGNLYITDNVNGDVVEVTPAGVASILNIGTPGGTALKHPAGIAVDGAGNVYIADIDNSRVVKMTAEGVSSVLDLASLSPAISGPVGIGVDSSGNVYIADSGNSRIVEVAASGAASVLNVGTLGGLSLNRPQDVAVDSSGNIYIADTVNQRILKIFAIGGMSALNLGSTVLSNPYGVAVDGAGDVYIADTGNSRILEWSATGVTSLVSMGSLGVPSGSSCNASLCSPYFLAVDTAGNLYIPDLGNARVVRVNQSQASPLTFASLTVGNTSPQQTVSVQNIGNMSLSIASLAATTNFNLAGTTTTCTTTTTLNSGTVCDLGVEFAPTTAGALTGTVNIADNSLNIPANVQTISLSGTSSAVTPPMAIATTTTITSPASGTTITPGLTGAVFSASVKPASGPAVAEGSVIFTSSDSPPVSATGTVTAGVATATLILPANPSVLITAIYTDPAGTYSGSTATTSVVVEDQNFSITVAPASAVLNILQGGSGTLTFTYTPVYGFSGTIATPSTSICSSISANLSCTFNPATVTLPGTGSNGSATSILTICTSNPCSSSSGAMLEPSAFRQDGQIYAAAAFLPAGNKASEGVNSKWPIRLTSFFGFFGILLLTMVRRGARKTGDMRGVLRSTLLPMLLVLGLFLMIGGCGSSSKPPVPPPATNVVPKGTYPVTFTFTSGTGASAITETVKLQIVVQ